MEHCGVLPTTQFVYRKRLGTCDMLLCVSHTLQSALESGQEARIVQIDFRAAFDWVNHQGILYKLSSTCGYFLENKLIGYADDSHGARVTVAESLNRNLVRVNAWCDFWGMKLNASKTKTMIVSRSLTMHPSHPH